MFKKKSFSLISHLELLSDIGKVFEWSGQIRGCRPDRAEFEGLIDFGGSGDWSSFGGAAALPDVLLQELDQFVLVLDHVAAEVLK